ncbi:MAG: GGDEF domain-containing protein [Saccharospirillaceae bacterium]|jgi:diguanylate cyclase (GGDEF)-like protein|nr:hypothetical protein A3759_10395 [Thalassolituus sp. HI0120]MCH2041916.1 GGDEF domain-containing protein [Saccharospirillaceae bacterium]
MGWRVLFFMVLGFIGGYLYVLYYMLTEKVLPGIGLIIAGVFAGGGWFVFMVTRMSLASLNKIQIIAEKYAEQSLHDSLTGLPNRKSLFITLDNTIAAAGRHADPFAVMVMDLNNFKDINDTLGHAAGDDALTTITPRLQQQLRTSDTLCRMGGDEFAVILPKTEAEKAVLVAKKLLEACQQPMMLKHQEVTLGVSIGIAVWPSHGRDGPELLQQADIAMYRAKKQGLGYAEALI